MSKQTTRSLMSKHGEIVEIPLDSKCKIIQEIEADLFIKNS